jgi:hypothetical protein
MNHVAIDLGGRESQICVRQPDGQILEENRCSTLSLRNYLSGLDRSKVVVETCAEAFKVADWATAAGHEVTVVPATLVRALGVGARGVKNDVRDARNLSEASCRMQTLPRVYVPSAASRELKSVCALRDCLVGFVGLYSRRLGRRGVGGGKTPLSRGRNRWLSEEGGSLRPPPSPGRSQASCSQSGATARRTLGAKADCRAGVSSARPRSVAHFTAPGFRHRSVQRR